ncbi:MerR family transcriptional regulator [Sinimarinibacterium sp. NLF-5-8]|uniref:MerR family transcriptional regulator n=1 Tax=Sinimarinibacterium sp. NLF-5-8 TaxID=2698684 RepID=UPI00137C2373|nr:MerR family transcriptional regulator [Sinimarinibacterium sp. NLF-5-8]QHS10062.1 MerR family transcriptional regulator [Sinimarinibacterium sp. NLF-5-8]
MSLADKQHSTSAALPEIPDKRYFTIGEVSELCDVKPHVLRYWEQEFSQLRPTKRRGNRRYYQQDDVLIVRRIRNLLYQQGFTIGGARQRMKELGKAALDDDTLIAANQPSLIGDRASEIKELRDELESLLRLLPE